MKIIKNKIKYFTLTLACLLSLFFPTSLSKAKIQLNHSYPKLANYYLKDTILKEEAELLSKWDLLILGFELQYTSKENLKYLKKLNPDIVLLAYVASESVNPSNLAGQMIAQSASSDWWLKDDLGNPVNFWPGTIMYNVTDLAPQVSGRRWNDFLPEFVNKEIFSNNLWDGIFYDNAFEIISWLESGNLDLDGDGKREDPETIDRKWREGMEKMLKATREIAKDKIIIVNSSSWYLENLNGRMFEAFLQNGSMSWERVMKEYEKAQENARYFPKTTIINATTGNTGKRDNWQWFRFSLTSTLLKDGFFSFDFGDKLHSQLWWYDEYDLDLGKPQGKAYSLNEISEGIWRRDFEKGIVLVNSSYQPKTLKLEKFYRKIKGSQDPKVNSGALVNKIDLPAQDGIILLREENKIKIFDKDGNELKFSVAPTLVGDRSQAKAWATDLINEPVAFVDLDGDSKKEKIVTTKSGFEIYTFQGEIIKKVIAYNKFYNQGINLVVGDLNKDGFQEIIVGSKKGGGPHVRIFGWQGNLLSPGFFAYDKRFRGGVNLALGDLDNDGYLEIVTGASQGGGPHVRIFNWQGKLVSPGFFAFDKNNRNGVEVKVVDVDGDGKQEIICRDHDIY